MVKPTKTRLMHDIMNYLMKYSDEQHYVTLQAIYEHVSNLYEGTELHIDRVRRIVNELVKIQLFSIEKYQESDGKPAYYRYDGRLFELYELRMLIDAVVSARFITKKEKTKIVEKLKQLTSLSLAKNLQNQIHINKNASATNEQVKYWIDTIHRAITKGKQIKFKYGRYNIELEFVLSRNGDYRVVNAYALHWDNDYYYLIATEEGYEDRMIHYRVDRMRDVTIEEKDARVDPLFNVSEYTDQLFHMYSGKRKQLKAKFKHGLINVITDRFGTNIKVEKVDDEWFLLETKAILSEGLLRWLMTWGSDVHVLAPIELVEKIKDENKRIAKLYST